MANIFVTVTNNRVGSVALDTVKGMVSINGGGGAAAVEVTTAQLARINAVASLVVTGGGSADTNTPYLALIKENDSNVDVFAQAKLDGNFDKVDYFAKMIAKAAAGDMVLVISPATVDREATSDAFNRTVTVTLKDAAGAVHTWYNGDLGATIAETTAGNGAATITDATPPMVAGVCTIEISATGAWAAADTNTLTIAAQTIMGKSVTGGTSVETIVAGE